MDHGWGFLLGSNGVSSGSGVKVVEWSRGRGGESCRDRIICDLNKTPDLFQESHYNCAKCGNPVDGQYCQGCALLRKKFKEDLFTYCIENGTFQDFQDTSEPPMTIPTLLMLAIRCQARPRLHNDVQNIHKELEMYINTLRWDRHTICYNDDDDEDYTIAITPILSTEEPNNSLSMRDEHLDTILATKSDEVIKYSIENLVLIPSESEGIPDNVCDVRFYENSLPLDISKDQFEDFFDSNEDSTSIDDDSFSIDDIEYVEASPPDSELVSVEYSSTSLNFLFEETNTFDNSLPESKTFCFDLDEISSGSTTTRSDISLLDYKAFYDDHVKEISSGSTTTHSNFSLPDYKDFYDDHVKEISSGSTTTHSNFSLYDSFIFDLSINPFPPADRSDFYEFVDELANIISPLEYDCFCFKNEPNSGDFTMDVVEGTFPTREPRVHVHNVLLTHPTLQLNLDFILSSEYLFAYFV
nr:hypothetical protein [Tanacetum cinerariifolium]